MNYEVGDKIIYENKGYVIVGINEILVGGNTVKEYILINWTTGKHLKVNSTGGFKYDVQHMSKMLG